MVIQCPACQTRFRIADEKVGANGVQVRCSKCANTFPVRREDGEVTGKIKIPATLDPIGGIAAPPSAAPSPQPSAPPAAPPESPRMPTPTPTGSRVIPPDAGAIPAANAPGMIRAPSRPEMGTERTRPDSSSGARAATLASPPPGFGAGPATVAAPSPFGAFPAAGGPSIFGGLPPSNSDPFGNNPGAGASPSPLPAGFGPSGLPAGIPDPFAAIADGAPVPGALPTQGFDPFAGAGAGASAAQPAPPPFGIGFNESPAKPAAPAAPTDSASPAADGAPEMTGNSSMEFGAQMDFGAAAAEAGQATAAARPKAEVLSLDVDRGPAAEPEPIPRGPRPSDVREKRKKKPQAVHLAPDENARGPRAAYRILIALFFVGAFVGGYASLTDGSFAPARLDRGRLSLLLGPPKTEPAIAGLAMTARSGGFLETAPGRPRIFVAQGMAINASPDARGFFEIRGRLKDTRGEVLAETTVPCGNTFREEQIRKVGTGEELARLYVPLGDGGSNAKIDAGSAVGCMVVFFDAPPATKVAEYELEIVSAQPAS